MRILSLDALGWIGIVFQIPNQSIGCLNRFSRCVFESRALLLADMSAVSSFNEVVQQFDLRCLGDSRKSGEVAMVPAGKSFGDVARTRARSVKELAAEILVRRKARTLTNLLDLKLQLVRPLPRPNFLKGRESHERPSCNGPATTEQPRCWGASRRPGPEKSKFLLLAANSDVAIYCPWL